MTPLLDIFSFIVEKVMAKSNTIQVKLVSTADTGFFYVKNKNPKQMTDKLELKKYDPKSESMFYLKNRKLNSLSFCTTIFNHNQFL